jgi:hypothetical protein
MTLNPVVWGPFIGAVDVEHRFWGSKAAILHRLLSMWDWLNGAYTLVCDTLPEDLLQFVGSESLVCAHCKSGTAIPKALKRRR